MDIEDFFSGESKSPHKEKQEKITLSVIDSFIADPLIYRIGEGFDIIRDNPVNSVNRLIEGVVNSGLIATLDYAKGKGNWKLIPKICIAAKGSFKTINLFFNKEIRDLKTIAVDSNDPTSLALMKIIMQEKYEIAPNFLTVNGQLDQKLNQADAALLSGNEAFNLQQSNKMFVDLSDEWFDLTGLPFVYAIWVIHEMDLNASMIDKIKSTTDYNIENQNRILKSVFEKYKDNGSIYRELINDMISYNLGMEEKEAINEFFRYSFFFGLIEHIPDLHYCD